MRSPNLSVGPRAVIENNQATKSNLWSWIVSNRSTGPEAYFEIHKDNTVSRVDAVIQRGASVFHRYHLPPPPKKVGLAPA